MRIAVIGSGIAGLSSAWLLSRSHEVTLYEANDYLGGHTHTVDVTLDGVTHGVDTGFLVFNHRTYPNLVALFSHLGVETAASDMSFGVSLSGLDLEWAGSNLGTVFAQKSNLLRRRFWGMLSDILRFNREAGALARAAGDGTQSAAQQSAAQESLGAFLDRGRYGKPFRDWYLLPMAGAIWSCPTQVMLDYPVATFARFCANHGLLQVEDRPQWHTVRGGARRYVDKLAAGIAHVRLSDPVRAVRAVPGGVRTANGGVEVASALGTSVFDQVVLACHSPQALAMLADATDAERELLSALPYQRNRAILHTDEALLPRRKSVWSAWNYLAGEDGPDGRPVGVSYLINKLQPLPFKQPVVVTLNPPREPDPAKVIAEFDYEHPVFDLAGIAAQSRLLSIQGRRGLWFCGAWCGYGFHEDGLKAGLAVANALGERAPWQQAAPATRVAGEALA